MLLSQIFQGIEVKTSYPQDMDVMSIELNSKKVEKGGLFIALSGK